MRNLKDTLMKLFTKDIEARMLANGRNRDQDHAPVVKTSTHAARPHGYSQSWIRTGICSAFVI